ncbi:hypothetical protein DH2020_014098 [Rehmannia glutinosa]|uniref:Uncharacterized protein n=1 Tax=Rehmannia glutinosa TaxID=99300 RepID=A0ABR0WVD8_REHGL
MSEKNLSIDELCGRMQLEEDEEGGLLLDNIEDGVHTKDLHWCLVGRFLSDRQVQVYDLPFGFMMENVSKSIGNFIGTYVDSDQHRFMGIQVGGKWLRSSFPGQDFDQQDCGDSGYSLKYSNINHGPKFQDKDCHADGMCANHREFCWRKRCDNYNWEKDCRNIVEQGWNRGMFGNLQGKIALCGTELFKWGEMLRNSFSNRIGVQLLMMLKISKSLPDINDF